MLHIAIIGSGPAGCYLADQLVRLLPDASIDVLERLPVPFGLIRYGVAPDHQGTKAIARVLDRVLSRERVGFFGNVEVGRDVHLEELMSLYDAVVLATGATRDRRLGVPGEGLPGVVGSSAFTGWYNGHPDHATPPVRGVRSAVIIGNGNVAIDVARILAKSPGELAGSDLSPDVTAWLSTQQIETIHIVGRRGAADARFTEHELAELGTLKCARPFVVDPAVLTGQSAVVETLRKFAAEENRKAPVTIDFHFDLTPTAFLGDPCLRAAQFRSNEGNVVELPAQLAVTCIGYEIVPCCTMNTSNGVFRNEDGKVREGLYVVGWARRGPSGTIPTNRAEAQQVAQRISREVTRGGRAGGAALRELLEQRSVRWVDYAAWRRVDAVELARAGEGRCREKFSTVAQMLEAAQVQQNLSCPGAKG
jgi:NADPH-dependent glutamate synthase beta subunit-like oxidoreductase